MIESLILERMNASLSVASFCALIIFGRYIWKNLSEGYKFLRPAIAFASLWAGDAFLRTIFWASRHSINKGLGAQPPNYLVIAGNLMLMASILCCIRVFSETNDGNWPWVISFFAAVAIAIASPLI